MKIYSVFIRYDHNAYWDEDLNSVSEIQLQCFETLHQAEKELRLHYEKYLKALKNRNNLKITFNKYKEVEESNKGEFLNKEFNGFRIDFEVEERKENVCGVIIVRDLIFDIPDSKKRRKLKDIM